MESARIAIVGGSNSVIKSGYTASLERFFRLSGIDPIISNFAVGANSCLNGIANISSTNVSGYDVFILEYFVNDYSLFRECGERNWLAAFEAAIRIVRRRNPRARIATLLIGRRAPHRWGVQDVMRAHLQRLAEAYGIGIVDFDGYLHSLCRTEASFAANYRDEEHLQEALATGMAASMLASAVARLLRAPPAAGALPEPLSGDDLDGARCVMFDQALPAHMPRRLFENSRYQMLSVSLEEGKSIDLAVSGRPLALVYVSSLDACDLWYEDAAGSRQAFHTLHKKVQDKSYGFLVRTAPLMRGDWRAQAEGTIRIGASRSNPDEPPQVITEYNMVPNKRSAPQSIYIASLLVA